MKTAFNCPHCGRRILVTFEDKPKERQKERLKCLGCLFCEVEGSRYHAEVINCKKEVFFQAIPSYLVPGKGGRIKASVMRAQIDSCAFFQSQE